MAYNNTLKDAQNYFNKNNPDAFPFGNALNNPSGPIRYSYGTNPTNNEFGTTRDPYNFPFGSEANKYSWGYHPTGPNPYDSPYNFPFWNSNGSIKPTHLPSTTQNNYDFPFGSNLGGTNNTTTSTNTSTTGTHDFPFGSAFWNNNSTTSHNTTNNSNGAFPFGSALNGGTTNHTTTNTTSVNNKPFTTATPPAYTGGPIPASYFNAGWRLDNNNNWYNISSGNSTNPFNNGSNGTGSTQNGTTVQGTNTGAQDKYPITNETNLAASNVRGIQDINNTNHDKIRDDSGMDSYLNADMRLQNSIQDATTSALYANESNTQNPDNDRINRDDDFAVQAYREHINAIGSDVASKNRAAAENLTRNGISEQAMANTMGENRNEAGIQKSITEANNQFIQNRKDISNRYRTNERLLGDIINTNINYKDKLAKDVIQKRIDKESDNDAIRFDNLSEMENYNNGSPAERKMSLVKILGDKAGYITNDQWYAATMMDMPTARAYLTSIATASMNELQFGKTGVGTGTTSSGGSSGGSGSSSSGSGLRTSSGGTSSSGSSGKSGTTKSVTSSTWYDLLSDTDRQTYESNKALLDSWLLSDEQRKIIENSQNSLKELWERNLQKEIQKTTDAARHLNEMNMYDKTVSEANKNSEKNSNWRESPVKFNTLSDVPKGGSPTYTNAAATVTNGGNEYIVQYNTNTKQWYPFVYKKDSSWKITSLDANQSPEAQSAIRRVSVAAHGEDINFTPKEPITSNTAKNVLKAANLLFKWPLIKK